MISYKLYQKLTRHNKLYQNFLLRSSDTIYYIPDLVRISQPELISVRTFFGLQRVVVVVGVVGVHKVILC